VKSADTVLGGDRHALVNRREDAARFLNVIFTYSLTPHSTVLLENLTGLQLVKKFPAFYGTRKFITAFTSSRLLSLS
jgi:hypothetical protein